METVINNKPKTKYPCLKRLKNFDSSVVVLFTMECTGSVVYSNTTAYQLGSHSTNRDMVLYEPFEGEILLKS